VPVSASGLPCW